MGVDGRLGLPKLLCNQNVKDILRSQPGRPAKTETLEGNCQYKEIKLLYGIFMCVHVYVCMYQAYVLYYIRVCTVLVGSKAAVRVEPTSM